jgi:uncharacterized protein (UPF0147 family)
MLELNVRCNTIPKNIKRMVKDVIRYVTHDKTITHLRVKLIISE